MNSDNRNDQLSSRTTTNEEQAEEVARLTEAHTKDLKDLSDFNHQFDGSPETLARVTKSYENPKTLSDRLASLRRASNIICGFTHTLVPLSLLDQKSLLNDLANALNRLQSIVEQLKCKILIPVEPERLSASADIMRAIADIYSPNDHEMEIEIERELEDVYATGGFPFEKDVTQMAAYVFDKSESDKSEPDKSEPDKSDKSKDLWGGLFQQDESNRTIRRSGLKYQSAKATFSLRINSDPWTCAVALLKAKGGAVSFQALTNPDHNPSNLRQIAQTVRKQLKFLGVDVKHVKGQNCTWKAVLKERE